MLIERVNKILNVWSDYSKESTYKVTVDPKTQKETVVVIVYDIYDRQARLQQDEKRSIDIKA